MSNYIPTTGPTPIATEIVECPEARKTVFLDLIENRRGRALKLKERSGRDSIVMLPMENLREIANAMLRLADWSERNP